jgi:predicted RNase H-like nuclease (RuvC/YqgF family)
MNLSDSAYWRQIYPQPVGENNKKSHKTGYETKSEVISQTTAEIEKLQAKLDEAHQRIEQVETANQCSQKKQRAVELLNQFIEEAGVGEKIKHPGTNRTLAYLAKFQKWLGQLTNE